MSGIRVKNESLLCYEFIFCFTSQTMYGGSDDGSSCDAPGESLSELDLSEDGPLFSPDGSPTQYHVHHHQGVQTVRPVAVCLLTQVAGLLNLGPAKFLL